MKRLRNVPVFIAARAALLAFVVLILAVPALEAGEPLRPSRTATPPVIDGRLDDAVWQTSPRVTGFKTWMPDYGVIMTNQTVDAGGEAAARAAASTEGVRLCDYTIARSRTSYQVNRFLFFRAIVEYNWFRRQLLTDLLASFTYIPGTVLHAGYGSLYERSQWDGGAYVRGDRFEEMRRGVYLKASYLWRM
ncbi:MAG: hypothetical protein ACM3NQ_00660 [Bacteroidales bacterium]